MESIIISIDNYWFDVSEYASKHPGGYEILKKYHLKDATKAFNEIRGHADSLHMLESFEIKNKKLVEHLIQTQKTKKINK